MTSFFFLRLRFFFFLLASSKSPASSSSSLRPELFRFFRRFLADFLVTVCDLSPASFPVALAWSSSSIDFVSLISSISSFGSSFLGSRFGFLGMLAALANIIASRLDPEDFFFTVFLADFGLNFSLLALGFWLEPSDFSGFSFGLEVACLVAFLSVLVLDSTFFASPFNFCFFSESFPAGENESKADFFFSGRLRLAGFGLVSVLPLEKENLTLKRSIDSALTELHLLWLMQLPLMSAELLLFLSVLAAFLSCFK
mmetsp:Transcript_5261/g.7934  ORF Transcript_5261/g.7934 Transcript_5261/m.7934 type:complete len:255 (+) Transcript_5261:672-1436(+)